MKLIKTLSVVAILVFLASPTVFVQQGAGTEWDILNQEAKGLYRMGMYGRAVVVAKKALEVAEKAFGPNHPSVAESLNDLAELY